MGPVTGPFQFFRTSYQRFSRQSSQRRYFRRPTKVYDRGRLISEIWRDGTLTDRPPKPFEFRSFDISYDYASEVHEHSIISQRPRLEQLLDQAPQLFRECGHSPLRFAQLLSHLSSSIRPGHDTLQITFWPYLSTNEAPFMNVSRSSLKIELSGNRHQTAVQDWVQLTSSWTWPHRPERLQVKTRHSLINDLFNFPDVVNDRLINGRRWPLQSPVTIEDYRAVHPLVRFHFAIACYWYDHSSQPENEALGMTMRYAFDTSVEYDMEPLSAVDLLLSSRDPLKNPLRHIYPGHRLVFTRGQFESVDRREEILPPSPVAQNHVFIALGSNEGDSIELLERACASLDRHQIRILRTSALYETKPMYFDQQNNFLNAVLEARTTSGPIELLKRLKQIEQDLGRVKTMDNGPRTIDLDILLHNEQEIKTETLQVPHPRMMEREFVLRPLCDLIPNTPTTKSDPFHTFREQLRRLSVNAPAITPQSILSRRLAPFQSLDPTKPTRVMSVLNMTPDSFSDGGLHAMTDPQGLIANLREQMQLKLPPSILDVGGQSTRPHAPSISPEEEMARILPTIKAVRADSAFDNVAISVDTYRASVAKAAIEAGADLVNDVTAGQMDSDMLKTVGQLRCSYIMGHMRGTPETMTKLTDYPNGVIHDVGTELISRMQEAEKAGIRRWRIFLDPGIGFAKTQAQNLEILRRFDDLRNIDKLQGIPWVVGASRKGFIGKITGVEQADQRHFGTAACVTAAIKGGADIVRVHDVEEMGQVVAMADALWRS